jgi:hypothetical protein
VIVLADWMELLLRSNSVSYASLGKVGRAFRLMRVLRLVRVVKLRDFLLSIMMRIKSERMVIVASMVQFVFLVAGWSHLVACVWFGVGKLSSGSNWIAEFGSTDVAYSYTSSLHWALSQLTGGMDEIRAYNTGERVFCIAMFVVSFILAGLFVSHLTSSMTQLNMISSKQMVQVAALRRYLIDNSIPHLLKLRIQRSAQKAISDDSHKAREEQIELLRHISEPLLMELHFELYSPAFSCHPFLSQYLMWSARSGTSIVMERVCNEAVKIHTFCEGDLAFRVGEKPLVPWMYFVSSGIFQYGVDLTAAQDVPIGQWLSEPILWTEWTHRGTLIAQSAGSLTSIDSNRFGTLIRADQAVRVETVEYAIAFVQSMNELRELMSDMPITVVFDSDNWHHPSLLGRARRNSTNSLLPR